MIRKLKTGAQLVLAAGLLLLAHLTATSMETGWPSYLLGMPALVIILLTAVARAHDIQSSDARSFVRKIGLVLAAAGAMGLLVAPILGYSAGFPTWRSVVLQWGFALSWLTTPNMPPWWKYISGEHKLTKGQDA